jgi:anti-sigma-K factor RskA
MIDDRQEELASLYAFNLLEGKEREDFIVEMDQNPELSRHVAELRVTTTALAHAAPEVPLPPELKARILASAEKREFEASQAAQTQNAPVAHELTPFPVWFPWLAAACLSVATILAGRKYAVERNQFVVLSEQEHVIAQSLDEARAQLDDAKQLLSESRIKVSELSAKLKDESDLSRYKIATLASMLGNTPSAVAVAVWDPSRERGVLSVSKLPAAATEKDYQLWVIDKQYPAPVSAGTFVVDPVTGEAHIVFKADKPVDSIAKFAVSLERKGGSPSPEGPIVLISP